MNIPITEIKLNDRARQDFGDIEELAESIRTYGLIHPIALDANKTLIAGGRRFAALQFLYDEAKEVLESETTDDSIVRLCQSGMLELGKHYTSKADADVSLLDEMELEENIRRKNFNWKEEVCAIYKIHQKKKLKALRDGDRWGMRETGRLLGVSAASVQYAAKLYLCLQDPEHKVHQASSATDALHLLAQERAVEARRLAVARNVEVDAKTSPQDDGEEIDLDSIGAEFSVSEFPVSEFPSETSQPKVNLPATSEVVRLSKRVFCGDFMEIDLPKANHIITDPPYGIDTDNMTSTNFGMVNLDKILGTHQVEDNIKAFPGWLQRCYDLIEDNGYLIMFCDMVHWNNLRIIADEIGFKTQRWPFVWCKTHNCMNQAADFNFTKNFEVALIARKGAATLVKPQGSSYLQASNLSTKNRLSGHPFVKPLELWQHLASAVAIKGETIMDPFSGVGSMPVALIEAGFNTVTCEINQDYYEQQFVTIQTLYQNILGKGVRFE